MDGVYSTFGTDKVLEEEGILLNYGQMRCRIARAGGNNAAFRKAVIARSKPYRSQIDKNTIGEEESNSIVAQSYADAVILSMEVKVIDNDVESWRSGVPTEEPNTFLPFNKTNVIKLLTDLPELFADIRTMAADAYNFRQEELEADQKNLENS